MNSIQIFNNPEFGEVRTLEVNGEAWFVAKDVATILGYAKPLNAIAAHVDGDDSLKQGLIDSMGRVQDTILINESGVFSLILSSKLPDAKRFKHWITSEVLPAIHKYGMYATPQAVQRIINDPNFLIGVLSELQKTKKQNQLTLGKRPPSLRNTAVLLHVPDSVILCVEGVKENVYDLYIPKQLMNGKDTSLILFIHGGSFTSGDKADEDMWCKYFASKGFITATANYSLMGKDENANINMMNEQMLMCVESIKNECLQRGFDIKQMATSGQSAGGCLAMLYTINIRK